MTRTIEIEKELVKLTATDKEAGDKFGGAVAISGKYAIVGATEEDSGASNTGAAYIYVQNDNQSWTEVNKLQASNPVATNSFGCAVAISGKYAFVGAKLEDTGARDAGSVYVFEQKSDGAWYQVQQLQASDKEAYDYFGSSVSLFENYAVIGAPGEDTNGSASGAAYVFEQDEVGRWHEVKKLKSSNAKANDNFGHSVSVNGSNAIIGAYLLDTDGVNAAGACFVFERNVAGNWQEVQQLKANDKEANDNFGISVGIDGNFAVVGASGEDNAFSAAGAIYIYERAEDGQWDEKTKLQASDKQVNNFFGCAVSISGDTVVVGATGKDDNNTDVGGAYLYKLQSGIWSEYKLLLATDRQTSDQFGNAVAISGPYAIVGSALSDVAGSDSGAAYLFETDGNGDTGGGSDLDESLQEGLICHVTGGPSVSGHTGSDSGSFQCDGAQHSCVKIPGIKNMKSIAMWVKITEDRSGVYYLLDARDLDAAQGSTKAYIHTTDFGTDWQVFYVDGVSKTPSRNSYDDIPKNQWTHVYVETAANFDESPNFMGNYVMGETLKGAVDEIRIYDRSLTAQEIEQLAQS
jgi:predicted lipoprotein